MSDAVRRQIVRLCSDAAELQQAARIALRQYGPEAIPPLEAALDDPSLGSAGHWRILRLLSSLPDHDNSAAAIACLRRGLDRRDPILIRAALEALGESDAPVAAKALVEMTGHANQDWAIQAILALSHHRTPEAVNCLTGLLSHADESFRWSAVKALARDVPESIRSLLEQHARSEQNPEIRQLIHDTLLGR